MREGIMALCDFGDRGDLRGAIAERHSVRMYTDEPVADEALAALHEAITACNAASACISS
jgi:nitroreductase